MLRSDYQILAEGAYCEVWISKKASKGLRKAPAKDRARIKSYLEHLSEEGPENLHEQQYKAEGRFATGGKSSKNVMVVALKSYQLRLYGSWLDGPPRKLICPEVAIKKDDKADRDQLIRVARRIGEL